MSQIDDKTVAVPKECNNSDGDRIVKDIDGNMINLARCLLVSKEQQLNGETDYCDKRRVLGLCQKYKIVYKPHDGSLVNVPL